MKLCSSALTVLMATVASASTADSDYTYVTNGESVVKYDLLGVPIGTKSLPGPGSWPGSCNSASSTRQSPIDMSSAMSATSGVSTSEYVFNGGNCDYNDLMYLVEDNGVKVKFDKTQCTPPTVTLPNKNVFGPEKGKKYKLDQFHVHTLSEHMIDNKVYAAELHMVHLEEFPNGARPAAVVGFIIEAVEGASNAMFDKLLDGLEEAGCAGEKSSNPSFSLFNPYNMIPANTCFWNYDGSLTTPGCNEIVEWNLAEKIVPISYEQYGRLIQLVVGCPESISFRGSTSRPVQPLNGRVVNKICPGSSRMLR